MYDAGFYPGSAPALCPEITQGLIDSGSFTSETSFVGECGGNYMSNCSASWHSTVHARAPQGVWRVAPVSAVYGVLLPPLSPATKTGLRTSMMVAGSSWQNDGCEDHGGIEIFTSYGEENESTEVNFYGPLGLLGTFIGTRARTGDLGPFFGLPWAEVNSFIPEWMMQDDEEWPPEKRYAYNRFWCGSTMNGKFNNLYLANVAMVQFTPCTHTINGNNWEIEEESWSFAGARSVFAQAQAFKAAGGTTGYDWVAEGRNAALEILIIAAIEMAYGLNSVPTHEIRSCGIGLELY
jgi:hypothetical protein